MRTGRTSASAMEVSASTRLLGLLMPQSPSVVLRNDAAYWSDYYFVQSERWQDQIPNEAKNHRAVYCGIKRDRTDCRRYRCAGKRGRSSLDAVPAQMFAGQLLRRDLLVAASRRAFAQSERWPIFVLFPARSCGTVCCYPPKPGSCPGYMIDVPPDPGAVPAQLNN